MGVRRLLLLLSDSSSCSHTTRKMRWILLLCETVRVDPVRSLRLLFKFCCGIDGGARRANASANLRSRLLSSPLRTESRSVRRLLLLLSDSGSCSHATRKVRWILLLCETVRVEPVHRLRLLLGLRTGGIGRRAAVQDDCVPTSAIYRADVTKFG